MEPSTSSGVLSGSDRDTPISPVATAACRARVGWVQGMLGGARACWLGEAGFRACWRGTKGVSCRGVALLMCAILYGSWGTDKTFSANPSTTLA